MNKLKELRLSKRMTQQELADVLHTTKANICMIENNKRNLTASSVLIFANYFGVSTDYLLGKNDNMNMQTFIETKNNRKLTKIQNDIIEATNGLTVEEMDEVFNYIEYIKSKRIKGM